MNIEGKTRKGVVELKNVRFFIYLILDYGWTDDVKTIIAIPMFFYIPFLLVYLTNNKKEKAKFKKSVDEFLLTWIGIILAFCFVYFIFQI